MHASTTSRLCEFATLMAKRLEANDYKDGWWTKSMEWLFGRLKEEASELCEALCETNVDTSHHGWLELPPADANAIAEEAADVANFAFMIFDLCIAAPPPERES
jgi:NTP pyrophosphatase (non-canonical NTP hydrolase)